MQTTTQQAKKEIIEILRKVRDVGGCDAIDEYSIGWDEAVVACEAVIMEMTGITEEDLDEFD